ncbi:uncharacterized protein B0H18DRAFT_984702 [Fomitopsis serialis]|uniref:uncharacterized protein n=1 Tax=Fomitopsis serialis TaxID=139415 RepID=UPI00200845E8|nr:uncharacterized protein B0H18DRAFT_984702 [Neoantrodia serialis]KAH9932931.1 hypothetical protein B0H18DRAFT_984702 [Neoantrodia serialis]
MSSSDDAAVWQSVGHDLVQSFVSVTVETFVVAVYSVLVFETGRLLLRKSHTKVSLCTCLAVLVMYGLDLSLWMIDVHNVVAEIQGTLLSTSTAPLDGIYATVISKILRLSSIEDVIYAYMTIIGDGIIIWRAYAFWSTGREWLVLFVPLAFLAGSLSTSIMLTYCAARLGADIELGTYQHPAFCRNIQTASYSTTLATTAVTTMLIGYKTWKYRRTHIDAFGGSSPQTRTQRVMVMLIESGVLYMLFFVSTTFLPPHSGPSLIPSQLVQVIMSLSSVNASLSQSTSLAFAFSIYQYISSSIVGIYPTLVVILVNSKHSMLRSGVGTGSSNSALVYKRGPGASEATYSSTATVDPARGPAAEISLYEMAQLKEDCAEDPEALAGVTGRNGTVKIQVQQSVAYDV